MSLISFYIPSLDYEISSQEVLDAFENIGTVHRIDFTPIHKKSGFGFYEPAPESQEKKSAFIHCSILTDYGSEIYGKINSGEQYKLYPFANLNECFNSNNNYWTLLPAQKQIRDTMMNRSQIVENCRHMERTIKEQQKTIKTQEETIEKLKNDVHSIKLVIEQLTNGLFNPRTQKAIRNTHFDVLFNTKIYTNPDDDTNDTNDTNDYENEYEHIENNVNTSEWQNYPTTLQGDYCEGKLDELEEKMNKVEAKIDGLEQKINNIEEDKLSTQKYEYEMESTSTSSSMPELININSDNEQDSGGEFEIQEFINCFLSNSYK